MKLSIAALAAAAALAACNGGSASPPPFNTGSPAPTPTPTVAPAVSYAIRWTGATHSTTHARARSPLDTTTAVEPIELAVTNGRTSLIAQSGAVEGTLQVTATSGGSPVPVPQPSPGSVSIANGALATANPIAAPTGSPSPGPLNVADLQSGTTPGSTSVSVRMPDGSLPSAAVDIYLAFAMEWPAGAHADAVQAYKVASGALVAASGAGDGDVYIDKPASTIIAHFPYGYESFAGSTPFSSISSALPFTPAGTSLDSPTLTALVTDPVAPIGGVIFKTATGDYVKVRFSQAGGGSSGGTPTFVMVGAAEIGPAGLFPL